MPVCLEVRGPLLMLLLGNFVQLGAALAPLLLLWPWLRYLAPRCPLSLAMTPVSLGVDERVMIIML